MTSSYDTYVSPLATRNASQAMLRLWSPRHKFNTWRRVWLAVAEAQHEVTKNWPATKGRPPLVTRAQIEDLRAVVRRENTDGAEGITDADIRAAERYERELRHDVMAHVHALGDACPTAKGIIHLGMTSQDVVCNADAIIFREAIELVTAKVARLLLTLGEQARRHAALPTLAFTHYQPAQPVTVGRRMAMWGVDLHLCLSRLAPAEFRVPMRGLRGATGTQASFLSLCESATEVDVLEAFVWSELIGNNKFTPERMEERLEGIVDHWLRQTPEDLESENPELDGKHETAAEHCARLHRHAQQVRDAGWKAYLSSTLLESTNLLAVTGQTYPRVIDTFILADLASTAAVLHKIATDIRLLSNRKELDEPFEDKQIGSSAMPYKRNPMRCERICGLTRFVMNLVGNAYDTAATQWLERTLDDSSNRRLSLPEAFLALDGALDLMHNVTSGLIVHEAMVRKNLMAELPFMATENILMACVKLGGDRQHYHELIRVHAQAAGLRVKQEGLDNDLLARLQADKAFWSTARGGPLAAELDWSGVMDPVRYVGRSVEQTERFIKEVVEPLRACYSQSIAGLEDTGPKV